MEKFDIETYLSNGVERIVKRAIKATLKDPKESAFMLKFAISDKKASEKRKSEKENGTHIPPFLIASITSSCNLHCAGCYARQNNSCSDCAPSAQLSSEDWLKVFNEAKELGVEFILLAGGEPLIRRDVIESAGKIPEIIFPVFTNGTLVDEKYIALFDNSRNVIPVFSIEGNLQKTDERRGAGVYKLLVSAMDKMHKNGLFFGASVTVTKSNIEEVVSEEFLESLYSRGCKVVFYVEYVPVENGSEAEAPGDEEREFIYNKLRELREEYEDMLFLSFPGDEKDSGGCLAAGRGFFHINSHGGAEPCPFSPYSDINVKETSLREAINSKLFRSLQEQNMLSEEHIGGCTLFEQKEKVEALLQR